MKDVTINIQAAAFPDQFVSDSTKDTVEYGLQIGQAIQYEWFRRDNGSCRFYDQWGSSCAYACTREGSSQLLNIKTN